ncbi:MAG: class I SAM-dependent methyltransferase [Byssovorax sp.]
MSAKKLLLIPQLMYYGLRAPRDQAKAWDRFWGGIEKTGPEGQVLWDTDHPKEIEAVLSRVRAHMDLTLPLVDVGCGNGRFSRLLGARAPRVVGVDVSSQAIARARVESKDIAGITFQVLDIGAPGAAAALHAELGDANVFMRGVLHVLDPKHRAAAAQNLSTLLGTRGVAYLSETNIDGDPLDHLVLQGATPTSMPDPLRRCIAAGIRPPSHFGDAEVRAYFPREEWDIVEGGPTTMFTVPLRTKTEIEELSSYYAVVRRKRA